MSQKTLLPQQFTEHIPTRLLVDKPSGITSFGIVARVRRMLKDAGHGKVKVGHAGTLDPQATGLLILGIGSGTKDLTQLLKLDKTYQAGVLLGEQRTTGDQEGDIIAAQEVCVEDVPLERIHACLAALHGTNMLPVPAFSAIKQQGQPLYKRARRGEQIKLPVKPMTVHEAQLLKVEQVGLRVHLTIIFSVGSGTYIRTLAEEIGRMLGVPATLASLRRTRIGAYDVADAHTITAS